MLRECSGISGIAGEPASRGSGPPSRLRGSRPLSLAKPSSMASSRAHRRPRSGSARAWLDRCGPELGFRTGRRGRTPGSAGTGWPRAAPPAGSRTRCPRAGPPPERPGMPQEDRPGDSPAFGSRLAIPARVAGTGAVALARSGLPVYSCLHSWDSTCSPVSRGFLYCDRSVSPRYDGQYRRSVGLFQAKAHVRRYCVRGRRATS